MQLQLTWDLVIVIFFAVVIAYTFIVGKNESVKVIISCYIAIVAVAGLGSALTTLAADSQDLIATLGFPLDAQAFALWKLGLLAGVIVFIVLKSGMEIQYQKEPGSLQNILLTTALGFATAGLFFVTLLTFVAGKPILDASLGSSPVLVPLLAESALLPSFITYQNLWFSFPALLLIGSGFLGQKS
jgi:hypothetical protein